jgi:hypothetical protein
MIRETAPSDIILVGNILTLGASSTAQFVASEAKRGRQRLQESYALGMGGKGVFDELCSITEDCRERNWDGYGAEPVHDETYRQAYRLLEALPLGTPPPSVGAEPDGHLTLEWYRSPRRTLSVSVSSDGDLHYAALLGAGKAYGTRPFFGETPKAILDLIREVYIG